jgi:hypothetical protein
VYNLHTHATVSKQAITFIIHAKIQNVKLPHWIGCHNSHSSILARLKSLNASLKGGSCSRTTLVVEQLFFWRKCHVQQQLWRNAKQVRVDTVTFLKAQTKATSCSEQQQQEDFFSLFFVGRVAAVTYHPILRILDALVLHAYTTHTHMKSNKKKKKKHESEDCNKAF